MTENSTEPKPKTYRLKSMVLARILAEMTVLLILVTLPAVLTITGHLQGAPMTGKFLFFALSLISALILPAYAFITWRVVVDKNGLTAMSLAKHQRCEFADMKRLSRRSNWNWVRYVVEHANGELTFPIWLVGCNELVELLRAKLPGGGSGASNPFRKFSQDKISLLFQSMQAALGIGLVVVFWIFFTELAQEKTTNQTDLSIVLGFCLVITLIFLWRSLMIFLMPKSVELTPSGIVVDTMIFSRRITWQNVLNVKPALPLLPEGFMLKTAKGSFWIGNGMDAADELVASIRSKLPKEASKALPNSPSTQQDTAPATSVDIKPNESKQVSSTKIGWEQQTDFTPDGTKSMLPETSETNAAEQNVVTAEDESKASDTKRAPAGKKADRRFRKRKKKNPPQA